MEQKKAASGDVLLRLVGPMAIWAATKLVEAQPVQKALKKVDRRFETEAKRARRRAGSNRAWLAAGAAAFAISVSLLARASRK